MTQQFHVWVYSQNNGKQGLREMLAHVLPAASHTGAKAWKQASIHGRMSGQTGAVHPDTGVSLSLTKEILPLVTPWRACGMLRGENTQTQKDRWYGGEGSRVVREQMINGGAEGRPRGEAAGGARRWGGSWGAKADPGEGQRGSWGPAGEEKLSSAG